MTKLLSHYTLKRILKMLYNYAGTTVVRSLFFHKHHDYANNLKNKLSKLLAKRMGSRKREETGNSSWAPQDLTIFISSLAAP